MSPALPQVSKRGGTEPPAQSVSQFAFTILEMLVSMAVLLIILLVIFSITQQTGNAWRSTSSKIEAFQRARAAFETITQNLGQATLNTYYDYYDAGGNRRTTANAATFAPNKYGRYSDLHFLSGKSLVPGQVGHSVFFQTPAGYSDAPAYQDMQTLLNACGFFVKYDKDATVPGFLSSVPNQPADRYRFRLFEYLQPSQNLSVFTSTSGNDWFAIPLSSSPAPVQQLADNVIALAIIPKNPQGVDLTTDFEYDSRKGNTPTSALPQSPTNNQLPPLVEVIMVAVDEPSAIRICASSTAPDLGVASLLQAPDSTPASIEANLKTLENTLNNRHLTYRIFRTTVALRNAKWSS